jgi:hypothetical protein
MLLFATLESGSTYSLSQWCVLFTKFLFFSFLLLYMNGKYVVTTLRIYANFMVATVVLAAIAVIAAAYGFKPLATANPGGRLSEVYFGAYYVLNTPVCVPAPIFRIQGLSEEPGTYAFALLPAFFWLLIAERAYIRTAVIVLGLMLSMSFGAGLFLLLLLPIMAWKYSGDYKIPAFFLGAISVIGMMYMVSGSCIDRYYDNMDSPLRATTNPRLAAEIKACLKGGVDRRVCIQTRKTSLSTSPSGKARSYQDRIDGFSVATDYLRDNMTGTGAALGMTTVNNSISVGYVVAALEAGIIGGALYLCLFAIMGWLALRAIMTSNHSAFDGQVRLVVALSVCAVLVMGAQRIQPDLSFWHMWIYAMLLYLLQEKPGSKVTLATELASRNDASAICDTKP